jgi:predicted nucleic acid-binding protein
MKKYVLDCSVVIAWIFRDEATAQTETLREQLVDSVAIVPAIWHLEVTNTLVMSARRGRLQLTEIPSLIGLLESLPIEVDPQTSLQAFGQTFQLAQNHQLSAYDAAYLELAMRQSLPLATLDNRLQEVAKRCGVELLVGN